MYLIRFSRLLRCFCRLATSVAAPKVTCRTGEKRKWTVLRKNCLFTRGDRVSHLFAAKLPPKRLKPAGNKDTAAAAAVFSANGNQGIILEFPMRNFVSN